MKVRNLDYSSRKIIPLFPNLLYQDDKTKGFDDVRDVTIGNDVKTFYAFTDIFGGTDLVTGVSEIHLTELSDDVLGN